MLVVELVMPGRVESYEVVFGWGYYQRFRQGCRAVGPRPEERTSCQQARAKSFTTELELSSLRSLAAETVCVLKMHACMYVPGPGPEAIVAKAQLHSTTATHSRTLRRAAFSK